MRVLGKSFRLERLDFVSVVFRFLGDRFVYECFVSDVESVVHAERKNFNVFEKTLSRQSLSF